MEKVIYSDEIGLYYVELNEYNEYIKVYCDEEGNPLISDELEIYQQEDGAYYYIERNVNGEPYKVYCDINGNPVNYQQASGPVYSQQAANPVYSGSNVGMAGAAMVAPVKTKKTWLLVLISIFSLLLLLAGGYFAYSKFAVSPSVDVSNYEVEFKPTGDNGEAKANAVITKIPVAENVNDPATQDAIDELLKNANISYSKPEGLSNGDQVEVKVKVNESTADKYKLKVQGTFSKTFTVSGLSEKVEETKSDNNSENKSEDKESSKDKDSERYGVKGFEENSGTRYVRPGVGVNLRSEANDDSYIITAIPNSRSVYQIGTFVNSRGERWSRVNYGGREGWIRSDLLG